MSVDLIALAQLGGFATLGIVMTLAARMLFDALKKGDLVGRPVYERSEERADLLAGQLALNTEALRAHSVVQASLVEAIEHQTAALERRATREAAAARGGKDGQ
jgi:hypothetical protein